MNTMVVNINQSKSLLLECEEVGEIEYEVGALKRKEIMQ